jgi:hypothetical protein
MDPNPIKHPAVLIAHIRDELEPALKASGFRYSGRNNVAYGGSRWIDYTNDAMTLSIRFDHQPERIRLIAETLDGLGQVRVIAEVDCQGPVRSHLQLMGRVRPFIDSINSHLVATH